MKKLRMSLETIQKILIVGLGMVGIVWWGPGILAKPTPNQVLHLQVPILGTALNSQRMPMGLVSNIVIDMFKLRDQGGLRIQFYTEPDQFSLLARKATDRAIMCALVARETGCV